MLVGFISCEPVVAAHHDDHYLAEHRYERMWPRCPFGERLQWLRGESNTPKQGTKQAHQKTGLAARVLGDSSRPIPDPVRSGAPRIALQIPPISASLQTLCLFHGNLQK